MDGIFTVLLITLEDQHLSFRLKENYKINSTELDTFRVHCRKMNLKIRNSLRCLICLVTIQKSENTTT